MNNIDAIGRVRTFSDGFEKWLGLSLLRRAMVVSLSIVIIMRLWFAFWGTAMIQANGPCWKPSELVAHSSYTSDPEGIGRLFSPWQRWDAQFYLRIADEGYFSNDATPSFFPLFPVLIGVVSGVPGQDSLLGSFVVCTIVTFGAFVLIICLPRI